MGNRPDGLIVSQARYQSAIDNLENGSLRLDRCVGSLIQNAAHVAVALRGACAADDVDDDGVLQPTRWRVPALDPVLVQCRRCTGMTKRKHFSPEALESILLPKQRKPVPHAFVLDAISTLSPYTRPMFGCLAIYVKDKVKDKIVLILRDKPRTLRITAYGSPLLKNTTTSLRREVPNMRSIQVLGKRVTGWQILPNDAPDFESGALRACNLVLADDPRIGKIPGARTSKLRSKAAGRSSKQIKTSKKRGSTINFDTVRKIRLGAARP